MQNVPSRQENSPRFIVFCAAIAAFFIPIAAFAVGEDNPTGVTGIYSGNITTGGSYDPFTFNAMRVVDDIVVPGSIGAYPLKWTRFFNTRKAPGLSHWTYSYKDYSVSENGAMGFPDGRQIVPNACLSGIEESAVTSGGVGILYLADGGQVTFQSYQSCVEDPILHIPICSTNYMPIALTDPYGLVTTINQIVYGYDYVGHPLYHIDTIVDATGRYLKINWQQTNNPDPAPGDEPYVISSVQAFDANSQQLQSVSYVWTFYQPPQGSNYFTVLDHVDYPDGTTAHYTYAKPGDHVTLNTADDVRYNGAMRQIEYAYDGTGRIAAEKNFTTHEAVSSIVTGPDPSGYQRVETRGDRTSTGASITRTFTYVKGGKDNDGTCVNGSPAGGKLISYTDFLNHTTQINYGDTGDYGFVRSVVDPNGHTTTYGRQTNSWGIKTIMRSTDNSTIQQVFSDPFTQQPTEDYPYYLYSRTDENGHMTTYHRDSNNRITRKDYATVSARAPLDPSPAQAFETFTYNSFGQVVDHRLTSGGVEHFDYDARGRKTAYTDPATGGVTMYSYYDSGPWTDRLKTVTHPANASGKQATETYEYDYMFDVNGNQTSTQAAGRGLVTKVTYADESSPTGTSSVVKTYNKYGDLLTSTDELQHTTTFTYDDYGRMLTAKTQLNHTIINSYVPTGNTSSAVTTSKIPFSTTLPSGKQTTFEYDQNWRKRFVHVAPGTPDAATIQYIYDQGSPRSDGSTNIGLLTSMISPPTSTAPSPTTTYTYDLRDRQNSITDPLIHTTSFVFDAVGNKTSEMHANGESITFRYDELNRLVSKDTKRSDSPLIIDTVNMAYDGASNLWKFQDEDATARADTTNIYIYGYDLMNRPTTAAYPNQLLETHVYDLAGNVKEYHNRAGATQSFSYDNRNRSTGFTWNDSVTSSQSVSYDVASRKIEVDNANATIAFGYDEENHLTTQTETVVTASVGDNLPRLVACHYDADGNRDWIQYPSGTKLDYGYTQRNQVQSIRLDGQQSAIVNYGFDAAGNITARSLDNGTSTSYQPDAVNRDTNVVHTFAGSVVKRFDYAYNNVNDILAVQRNSAGGDGFSYDLTQQITGFQRDATSVNLGAGTVSGGTSNAMEFDGCGNRTKLNGAPELFNTMNQPMSVPHDTNGNVQNYNGFDYTYDAQNRLRHAVNSATGNEAYFYYDGLNRQVARVVTAPAPSPTPTPTPTATPTATPTPTPTATPTPTPPPNKVATPTFNPPGENIYPATSIRVTISTTTTGAQIRYTLDGTAPTSTHGTLINGSSGQTTSFSPGTIGKTLSAIAYKSGMTDSDVHSDLYWREGGGQAPIHGGMAVPMTMVTTTTFSVWDGDWAILEEYDNTGARVQGYVQGYHGLVKTLVGNAVYYYQDELGSTSHIANAAGALLEYYKYDLYGKPQYFSSTSQQLTTSTYGVKDLGDGGGRWMPELGLYDLRNRFMSPDLGRFLQPDPIGFKGDASNLYRYCGNGWANRTDPTGLIEVEIIVRAFIPQAWVGPFRGDNRTFSPSPNASSRVSVTARIETDPAKNHGQVLVGAPTYKVSPTQTAMGGEKTATGPQLPQIGSFRDKDGNVGISVRENVRNPYQPMGKGIRESLEVGVNNDATKAFAKGDLSRAPSHEVNVTPQGKSTTNIPLQTAASNPVRFGVDLQRTTHVDTGTVNVNQGSSNSSSGTNADSVEPDGTNLTNDSSPAFPRLVAPEK